MSAAYTWGTDPFRVQLWEDYLSRWHYDGPAACAPARVRRTGRGPHWRGEVTKREADLIRYRLDIACNRPRRKCAGCGKILPAKRHTCRRCGVYTNPKVHEVTS